MSVIRRRVVVSGRVQGVFFRDSAQRRAESRGVAGHACNLADGRVELEFEGEAADVAAMVAWAGLGPARAVVTAVEVEEQLPTGRSGFLVR